MVEFVLYVEGGGDSASLRGECRRGFSQFLKKAGLKGNMPRIVASGSRQNAYKDFCTALQQRKNALLLVDSEGPVTANSSWEHLHGDKWPKPNGAHDDHCHLMVQCMESWFLADRETLTAFFGQGFQVSALPVAPVETIDKQGVYQTLEKATKQCKIKAPYGKGDHSFQLLALIDPAKVAQASSWADRFLQACKKVPAPF